MKLYVKFLSRDSLAVEVDFMVTWARGGFKVPLVTGYRVRADMLRQMRGHSRQELTSLLTSHSTGAYPDSDNGGFNPSLGRNNVEPMGF